ncbi:hypothetical protein Tco_0681329 [Tanacetum coccineum]|uniref:Uncharacterized protein n=1 Tax=Tanacetum coccineum TaxID=301880 RepID=A0ABQ4XN93_9ASTR
MRFIPGNMLRISRVRNYKPAGHFYKSCPKPVASKDKEVHMEVETYNVRIDDKTLDIAGVGDFDEGNQMGTNWGHATWLDTRGLLDIIDVKKGMKILSLSEGLASLDFTKAGL